MIGDSADNIPGIPKVGPKTAMGLLRRFPNLDLLRENFDRLTAREQTLLGPHMETVFMYRELTALRTDQCAAVRLEDLAVKPVDQAGAARFLREYEFRSLSAELEALAGPSAGSADPAPVETPPAEWAAPARVDRVENLAGREAALVNSLWIAPIVVGMGIFSLLGWLWAGILAKSPKVWRVVILWGVVVALSFLSIALYIPCKRAYRSVLYNDQRLLLFREVCRVLLSSHICSYFLKFFPT